MLSTLPKVSIAEHEEVLGSVEAHRLSDRGIGWVDAHRLASASLTDATAWTADRILSESARHLGIGWSPEDRGVETLFPAATKEHASGDVGRETPTGIKGDEVGQAVQFDRFDRTQVRMGEDRIKKGAAQPGAAIIRVNDHIEDERFVDPVGQHAGEGHEPAAAGFNQAEEMVGMREHRPNVLTDSVLAPPFVLIQFEQFGDMVVAELVDE